MFIQQNASCCFILLVERLGTGGSLGITASLVLRFPAKSFAGRFHWQDSARPMSMVWLKKEKTSNAGQPSLRMRLLAANVHDSQCCEQLFDQRNSDPAIYADSAYRSGDHERLLKRTKFKSRVHYRAWSNMSSGTRWRLCASG